MKPPQNLATNGPVRQDVIFLPVAHQELLKGATILAEAVKSTMGPSGHSVIIDMETGPPLITKDGVTVAKSINLKNRVQSMGAELLKEVASKTNDIAGDGTTTATVLGHALLVEGIKMIATGRSSISLKQGMDLANKAVHDFLTHRAIPVSKEEDIINVGTISANGDREIGELIAKAINRVGKDGIITVEPAKSVQTALQIVEGMQLDNGYLSPFFITNGDRATCELENPMVLISSNKISAMSEIVPVLESVLKTSRPLLIIADDVEGEALHTLIVNKMKGTLKVCAIKAPSYGEHRLDILSDLQALIGGNIFGASTEISLNQANSKHLGEAKKIIIGRNSTTIIGNGTEERKNKIVERVTNLRNLLADSALDALHMDKYRKRLARLSGGIAVIRVGGSTEIEIFEKKDRVEDAVNATLAAAQEGIIPGGGTALFYAAQELKTMIKAGFFGPLDEDVIAGINMVANVCECPLETIVENTGVSSAVVKNKLSMNQSGRRVFYIDVEAVQPEDLDRFVEAYRTNAKTSESVPQDPFCYGYNAAKKTYGNLVEEGIIDPIKVARYALEHAISVVGLVITCNSIVVNQDD
jgi:chaperonin GroEL